MPTAYAPIWRSCASLSVNGASRKDRTSGQNANPANLRADHVLKRLRERLDTCLRQSDGLSRVRRSARELGNPKTSITYEVRIPRGYAYPTRVGSKATASLLAAVDACFLGDDQEVIGITGVILERVLRLSQMRRVLMALVLSI